MKNFRDVDRVVSNHMFRTPEQTSKPKTTELPLLFPFYLAIFLSPCNTITFHNISGVHGFVSFTVKHTTFYHSHKNNVQGFCLVLILSFCQAFKNVLLLGKLSVSCERPLGKHCVFICGCSLRTAERNI